MQITPLASASISSSQPVSGDKRDPATATGAQTSAALPVDPNFRIGMSLAELDKKQWNTGEARIAADNQAGDSFLTIKAEVEKLDKSISKIRPDIKSSDWDFSVKDGKFVVTGSRLKANDIKFLESRLNGDVKLTAAAKSFMKASVSAFETTHDNPTYYVKNSSMGTLRNYTFYNVANQTNGSIRLKDLVNETVRAAGLNTGTAPTAGIGNIALEIVASHLTSSDRTIGYEVFPSVNR